MTFRSLCIAVTLLLSQSPVRQPQTYVLDFVTDQPTPEAEAEADKVNWTRPLVVRFEAGDGTVPFEVTLLSLDQSGYTMGDDVFFDVVLKHIGTKPFPFPMSQDKTLFKQEPPGAVRAHMLLALKEDMFGFQLVGFENIAFGATSLPETVAMLQPGDVVKIRGRGRWWFNSGYPKQPPDGWLTNVKVRAHLQLEGVVGYRPIVESVNQIEIQLQQRR